VFDFKKMPLGANIAFSLLDSVTMGFQNLSLGNNSVSFYQMCKLLVAPCTVVVQRMFFGEKLPSPAVSMALVLLLAGEGRVHRCTEPNHPLSALWLAASGLEWRLRVVAELRIKVFYFLFGFRVYVLGLRA
jgi:hypothetical protein